LDEVARQTRLFSFVARNQRDDESEARMGDGQLEVCFQGLNKNIEKP
jgi:hypothetical protein